MVWQRELLFERLKVVESMRSFISHRLDVARICALGWSNEKLISLLSEKLLQKEPKTEKD